MEREFQPYTLAELLDWIPKGWRRPSLQVSGVLPESRKT